MTAADASFLQYKWNNAKRLTTVTNNAGETIEYGYNANGDVTSSVVKSASAMVVKQQSALFDELVRFPASWNQLAEKESHQINNLEQILVAKVFNFCGICSRTPDAVYRSSKPADQLRL